MNNRKKRAPLIKAGMVPAATVTTALMSPTAFSASGDLDPTFGDVGRLSTILSGPTWSAQPQSDGRILLGGGSPGFEYWGWNSPTNLVTRLLANGSTDPTFIRPNLAGGQIVGVVQQPDGLVVAAGRRMNGSAINTQLVVYRIQPNGVLDPTFANGGSFLLSADEYGARTSATSVTLDPDGRIVVAGSRDEKVLVLRLLPDGSMDPSFGAGGIFDGVVNATPWNSGVGASTALLRTSTGGYRLTAAAADGCQIVALTADGALDASFGNGGIASISTNTRPTAFCSSLDAQPDGRLLVAGNTDARGFAARLLADGQPDPTFMAGATPAILSRATAIAADGNSAVVVAGMDDDGGIAILRLTENGALDTTFGDGGKTTFDLETEHVTHPTIYDLFVTPDRRIVGAGGACLAEFCWLEDRAAVVVRLLGDGGDSPGVLGISEQYGVEVMEQDGDAVLNVRRTGGRSGSVSIAWELLPFEYRSAKAGVDYEAVSGRLSWDDGDAAAQQIRVPILSDSIVEEDELLQVVLTDLQGGAGFGKRRATIAIAADGAPYGQFGFPYPEIDVTERQPARVVVSRNYYSSGVVSVTLTPKSGSATAGQDFVADPVTLTWADGELGEKDAVFEVIDDSRAENRETFTVTLSNATGGALIGPHSVQTVNIDASDRQVGPARPDSGGGSMGVVWLLTMALIRCLRGAPARRWSTTAGRSTAS
ncbi:MAG: Calx-beta domain-containing protein [Woeseiaceae bacterium]|nr:Calx-beta domain-containing protein [Woeseiaceae bacterium]